MVDYFGHLIEVEFNDKPRPVNVIKPLYLSGNAVTESSSTDSIQLASVGIGTTATSDGLVVVPAADTNKGIIVRAFSGSQSANLQEWQNSGSTVLVSIEADGTLNLASDFEHSGTNFGVFGATPMGQTSAYSASNVTPDRTFDADSTTLDELADVVGTMISDFQGFGFFGS